MKNNRSKLKIFLAFGVTAILFTVLGYFRAVPSSLLNQNNTQTAKIVLEPQVFDFGEVEFGKIVEQTFSVKNIGNKTLEIKRVSTSCACTKAKIDKERLEPEETANLLVSYDSGAMGKQVKGKKIERFIYIKSSDLLNPQVEITIYARVK